MATELVILAGIVFGVFIGAALGWLGHQYFGHKSLLALSQGSLQKENEFQLALLEHQKEAQHLTEQLHQLQSEMGEQTTLLNTIQQQHQQLSVEKALATQECEQLRKLMLDNETKLKEDFSVLMQNLGNQFKEQLFDASQKEQTQRQGYFEEKVQIMLKPLQELVNKNQEQVNKYRDEHLKTSTLITEKIDHLAMVNKGLEGALSHNKGRGDWGEVELIRLLEDSGLQEGVGFEKQEALGNKRRPDIRIKLPDHRSIFVDSKALQVDISELAQSGEQDLKERQKRMAKSLEAAINGLAEREYQAQLDGAASFVILFVPRESMLADAVQAAPNLFEKAYRQRVLLAGPYNLMGLLKLVHHGWMMARLSNDAQHILNLGEDLYKQVTTFATHFDRLGKDIEKLTNTHKQAWTSFAGGQGVIKKIKTLEEYGAHSKASKQLPEEIYLPQEMPQLVETSELLLKN